MGVLGFIAVASLQHEHSTGASCADPSLMAQVH
jgi:hypothetical protein